MDVPFLLAAGIAVAAAIFAVTRLDAVHALLYLIAALLALAFMYLRLGAPFASALQVIVYAGAIMVLFVFVVMMLNLGAAAAARERRWTTAVGWRGPLLLGMSLAATLGYAVFADETSALEARIDTKAVGVALFGPYLVVVELASLLLIAGLVAAWHVGRRELR